MEDVGFASRTYFWHALESIADAIGVTATFDLMVADSSCSEKAPPSEPPGVTSRLRYWGPGVYCITADSVKVSATLELGGASVGELFLGETIEVLDVVYRPYEHRLRGRIDQGWISLMDTQLGVWWVSMQNSRSNGARANTHGKHQLQERPNQHFPRQEIPCRVLDDPVTSGARRDSIPKIPPPPSTPRALGIACHNVDEPLLELDFGHNIVAGNPAQTLHHVDEALGVSTFDPYAHRIGL